MTVRNSMNPNVATIDADDDALRAAVMMREEHVGDLVVIAERDGRSVPVGVVTDRDIVVEIVARGVAPEDVRVGDMLKRSLVTVGADNGLEFTLRQMHQAGVRRAPVVDASGRLVGVLALDDVIDHLAMQLNEIVGAIRWQQTLEERQIV